MLAMSEPDKDEVKPAPSEPAPKTPPGPKSIGGVPIGIVKGGTTSWRYDQQIAQRDLDTKRRQAHEDRTRQIAATQEDGVAHLGETSFMRDMPRVVLFYMANDGTVRQECVSELTVVAGQKQGEIDVVLTLVCPKCLERGEPPWNAQLKIHSSHRKFFVRGDRHTVKLGGRNNVVLGRGEIVDLRTPFGDPWPVVVCGSVSTEDIIRCSNMNCNWAVRIDESRVYEV